MRVAHLGDAEPFVTLDGNAGNQSLAEATVPEGGATTEHFHRTTEEVYLFTHGIGRMRLGEEERDVAAGDTVVIAPG
jgi:mannose-6-phosphate isomerase-like protein (cupin superfamily)